MKWLNHYQDHLYSAARIVAGAMFSFHGAQKVLGFLAEKTPTLGSQLWIGGLIELVAGVLIAVGLGTSWAAFVSSGQMAVAYIQFHWKFQAGEAFFPGVNHGELAVLYCFFFLYIAAKGGGKFSLDGLILAKCFGAGGRS